MIELRRIDHVCLRVADVEEAAARWWRRSSASSTGAATDGRALLSCDDEPYSLELAQGEEPGHDHTGFELARGCSLDDARAHFARARDHLAGAGRMPLRARPRRPGGAGDAVPRQEPWVIHARALRHRAAGRTSQARPRQLPQRRISTTRSGSTPRSSA